MGCVRVRRKGGGGLRGPQDQSSPFPWTLTLAAIRTVRMSLGLENGGSGRGSLTQTRGQKPGGSRSGERPLNLQRLTCTQPRRRAPDQHRLPAAGPASCLLLARVGRFPLLGLPNRGRALGVAAPPANQRARGAGVACVWRVEGAQPAGVEGRGEAPGVGEANTPAAGSSLGPRLCLVTYRPAVWRFFAGRLCCSR